MSFSFTLVVFAIVIVSVPLSEAGWCNYGCRSNHPNQFGFYNFDTGIGALPFSRARGYQALDFKTVCKDSNTNLVEALHPQPSMGDNLSTKNSENFIMICPEKSERTINLISGRGLNGELTVKFSEKIEGGEEIVGFISNFGRLVVLTERTVKFYEILEPNKEALELLWEYSAPEGLEGVFFGVPIVSSDYVIANFGNNLIRIPSSFASNPKSEIVETIKLPESNSLAYNLIDVDFNVYYCSETKLFKQINGGELLSLDLNEFGVECSHIVISEDNKMIISAQNVNIEGSVVGEVDLTSFNAIDWFAKSSHRVNALSRVAWNDSIKGRTAYLALSTDDGVQVIADRLANITRGELIAEFPSDRPVSIPISLTGLAEPIVFSKDGVIAFSSEHIVKFFAPDISFSADRKRGDFVEFEKLDLFSSPLLLGKVSIVAVTKKGEAILYSLCTRYKLGEEIPEKACPIADLPDKTEFPTWFAIVAGAGAVLTVPIFGEFICKKMKIVSDGDDEEDYEDDEDFDEQTNNDVILAPVARM